MEEGPVHGIDSLGILCGLTGGRVTLEEKQVTCWHCKEIRIRIEKVRLRRAQEQVAK